MRWFKRTTVLETSGKPVETNGKSLETNEKPVQTNGNQCNEESIKGNSQLTSCYYVNDIEERSLDLHEIWYLT